MNEIEVKGVIFRSLIKVFDYEEANKLTELCIDKVMTDLEECADKNFNDSDVSLALARVLISSQKLANSAI